MVCWRERGYIKALPSSPGLAVHYSVEHIDVVLATHSRNFKVPLTTAALLSKKTVLMTPAEARIELDIDEKVYLRLVKGPDLEVLRIGHETRVTRNSVAAYKQWQKWLAEQEMERSQVCHVLGLGGPNIAKLVKAGRLLASKPQGSRDPILKGSVVALLRELLPKGVDPHSWIQARLASMLPLYSMHEIELLQLDRPAYQLVQLIANGHVVGIQHAISKRLRLAPETWLAYLQKTEHPISDAQLASVFGAESHHLQAWDRTYPGWRKCHVHHHEDTALYSACVLGLLRQYLSKGGSPSKWYKARLEKDISTVGLETTAHLLGGHQEAFALTQQGKLTGLLRPDGVWRYSRVAVEVLSRRRAKAARSD